MMLYTKHNCPNCEEVKKIIESEGIELDIVNVEEDSLAYADMIARDLEELPILVDNSEYTTDLEEIKNKIKDN